MRYWTQTSRLALLVLLLVPTAVFLGGAAVVHAAPECTITWDGSESNSWHVASNWDLNRVPVAGDVVCVPAGVTVTHSTGTTTIQTLLSAGTVSVTGGTLNLTGIVANESSANEFRLAGGILGGAGTLTVTGTLSWTAGTMQDQGTTRIESGATLPHNGTVSLQNGRTLLNLGRIELQGAGFIQGTGAPEPLLHNMGTIEKTSPAGSTPIIHADLDNDGVVRSTAGTLDLRAGSGTATGDFGAAAAAGTVAVTDGTFVLGNGASFLGGVAMTGATVNVSPGAIVTSSGSNGFSSGNLGGAGTFDVAGFLHWTGGVMRDGGTTTVAPDGVVAVDGTTRLEGTRVVENAGRFEPRGSNFLILGFGSTSLVHNTGEIEKTGPGTFFFGPAVDNDGAVESESGLLALRGGGGAGTAGGRFGETGDAGVVALSLGNFNVGAGASLDGSVDFAGATLTVPAGAALEIDEEVKQTAGAVLGEGALRVTGTLLWQGGRQSGPGETIVEPGALLTIDANCSVELFSGRRLTNDGTVRLVRRSTLHGIGQPAPSIENSGTFEIDDSVAGPCSGAGGVNANLHNTGLITKVGGAETPSVGPQLDNDGVVNVAAGGLLLENSAEATQTGTFAAAPGASLAFHFGTFVLGAGATLAGSVEILSGGRVDVAPGVTIDVADTLELAGIVGGRGTLRVSGQMNWIGGFQLEGMTLVAPSGTLTIDSANGVDLQDGRILVNRGTTIWAGGGIAASGGSSVLNAGTFEARSDDIFLGSFDAFGSTLIHNVGLIRKSMGAGQSVLAGGIDNEGTIEAAAGTLALWDKLLNLSTVTNSLTGGTFVARNATLELPGFPLATNASTLVLDGAAAQLTAHEPFSGDLVDALGDLRRNTAVGELRLENGKSHAVSGEFHNLGVVSLGQNAEFTAGGRYVQAGGRTELSTATSGLVATGADVELVGGRLGGVGTVGSRVVTSGGELNPGVSAPGTLVVDSLAAGSGGSISVQIEGSQASGLFDRLTATGPAQVAGTLRIVTASGFTPVPGDTYPIVTTAGLSGTFASVDGLSVGGVPTYELLYGGSGVALRVLGSAPGPPIEPPPAPPPAPPPPPPAPPPPKPPSLRVIDDEALAVLTGSWTTYRGKGFYGGTFTASSKRGSALVQPGVSSRRLGVLVGKCRRCGVLEVLRNGKLVRRIDLRARTARPSRLVRLPVVRERRLATITLRVASAGRPVRVDGLVEIAG